MWLLRRREVRAKPPHPQKVFHATTPRFTNAAAVVLWAVMKRRLFLTSLVIPVLAGCGARAPVRSTPGRYVRRGLASWYGEAFDGKPTASGETFDSN